MGRSFGGLIATNLANTTIGRAMFSGVILLTPYYRLFTERLYDTYKYLRPLCKIRPNFVFECEYAEMDPEYYAKYKSLLDDSRWVSHFTAKMAAVWVEEQVKAKSSIKDLPMPLCFIIASGDGVVRNDTIEEFADLATNELNEIHTIVGADHTDICCDKKYGSHLTRASLNFLEKVTSAKEGNF